MANNCKTTGVGPNCSPPEVGDGEKYECLEKEIRRCQGVLNRCIGDARTTPMTTHTFGSVYSGWIIEGASAVASRMASIAGCYDGLNCDFEKCYCSDWSCGGFCIETVGRTGDPRKPKEKEGDEEQDEDEDDGPSISSLSVTSSTYERVIERVYGTHIVTGNVFWTSDKIATARNNVRLNRSTGLYENVATTRYFLTFALGLCAGEIQDVLRIWADDVLIYSRDYTSTSSLVNGATINGAELGIDPARPYNTTFGQIHVYTGGEDQSPSPIMGDGLAYRGLAYIIFENFDITQSGGRLPTFRIEVMRNVDETADPILTNDITHDTSVTLGAVPTDLLYVLPATNTALIGGAGSGASTGRPGMRVIAYDTLDEIRGVVPGQTITTTKFYDLKSVVPLNDKYLAVQSGDPTAQRPLSFLRNVSPSEMATFGISAGVNNHSTTAVANLALTPYASIFETMRTTPGTTSYVLFAASDTDLGLFTLNMATGAFAPFVMFNDITSGPISKVVRYREYGGLTTAVPTIGDYAAAFAMNAGRTAIEVKRLTLTHSEGLGYFDITQTPFSYSIPGTSWGNVTSGAVLKDVIRLSYLDAFLLSVYSNGGSYLILWKPSGVVWSSRVTSLPVAYSVGARMYDYPANDYAWIGTDNQVYSINLASGHVTQLSTPAVSCVGAQYYNPLEASILYISATYEISKLFLTHKRAAPQSLEAIVQDILIESGLEETEIDASALSNVTLVGYKANNNTTASSILQQMAILYGLSFYEQSGMIVAGLRARGAASTVGPDQYNGDRVDVKFIDSYSQLLSVSLTYNSRTNEYKDQTQSMRKTQFVRGTEFVSHIVNRAHGWPVVMSDTEARAVCERILFEDEIVPRSADVTVGPQFSTMSPGDLIYLDVDGTVITMEILTIVEDFMNMSRKLAAREIRPELFIEAASVIGVTDFSGRYTSDPLPKPVATTPLVFPVPPPAHAEVSVVAGKNAIMMIGTDDGSATFVSRDVYYVNGDGVTRFGGTQTKRTLVGTLVTPPISTISYFSADKTSEMVIRFSTTEIADYLTNYASTAALLLAPIEANMIIVGQEWIQYQTYEIAGDGLTVTFRGLHRGLRHTDDAIDNHTAGEMCALYVAGSIVEVKIPLRDEDDSTVEMGVVVSGDTPDTSTFTSVPLVAFNLKAPAAPTVRRGGGGASSRQVSFFIHHRSKTELDLPNDDRPLLTHLNGGNTWVAILKGPYDAALFKQHVQQIYEVTTTASEIVPADTTYIARFLRCIIDYSHPIGFDSVSPYTLTQQTTDGVNAYDGTFYFAVFTVDNVTVPNSDPVANGVPAGYDYIGRVQAYYYLAGEVPPLVTTSNYVGDIAHPVLES